MPRQPQQHEPSFEEVWSKLPFVTRHLTLGATVIFLLCRLNPPLSMQFWYWERLPLKTPWTVFTSMLSMRRDPFSSLVLLVMFWMDSRRLEDQPLKKRSDLVFFYGFIQSICLALGPSLRLYAFLPIHASALTYTHCQSAPKDKSMVLGLVSVTNAYIPWLNAALGFVLGGLEGLYESLLGMFIGHLFLFLTELLPINGGPRLTTPRWLRFVDNQEARQALVNSFGAGMRLGKAPPKKPEFGAGNRLGGALPNKKVEPLPGKKDQ